MGTEFFLGMPYFVFNNSDLINSPNFPGIIDNENQAMKINTVLLFGIIISDFFKNTCHLKIAKKNENVRDEMINGAYSIWKDKLSLEILIKSEYMIKDV